MIRLSLVAGAAALALLAGCATTGTPATVVDTTARAPQLSTLNKLIADAGLADTLKGPGPYTVFAPSDEAFKAVPAKTLADLSADKTRLKELLSYHVLPGKVGAADVKNGTAKTVQGANLSLGKAGSYVTVEDAMVTQADLGAANGVVHVIDRVLMPPKK
ncbi:MAG: fasciclin domain-containing protein [Piscinibacter sp.]|uniref:fasciclin domain-containing protein n=1 Tax=Piscinibacter sp. TaxID=1903157 RepID=UPI0025858847|nr:fasciclin domain-containing protein [Piscinibacter sp.]MCW5663569.1 fasciclin domain-containing protein [Piscinibacter sp.]